MGTKMAVAFANLFMAEIETKMLNESKIKPKVWKRYMDDVISLWEVRRKDIDLFIEQANTFHPTIKFTAEISEKEITFLDKVVYNNNVNNVLFSSCCCLHWIFKFSNFSSIFSIFLLVSRLRAGELSESLGFLVSSPYNLSSEEKVGNYMVQITTINKGLKNYRNNYSNN